MPNFIDKNGFLYFLFYHLLKDFTLGGFIYMTTIQNILRPFAITRCYKGFYHVCYSIQLAVTDDFCLGAVTKDIYMVTASHFDCNWKAVERNIRTVVARAWQVNPELLSQMAGYPLYEKPTASEFIEIISSYILRTNLSLD